MPVQLGSAHGKINLDVSSLKKATAEAEAALNRLSRSSKSLESVQRALPNSTRATSNALSQSAQSARRALDAFDTLEATHRKASQASNDHANKLRLLKDALGTVGIAFGVSEIVQWGLGAAKAADQANDVRASVEALAGGQAAYNKIVELATNQQRLYGGSLTDNISQLGGLSIAAKKAGVGMGELSTAAQLLLQIDPTANFGDAAVALREAFSGDITSMAERFELPRSELKKLADEGLSGAEKMKLLFEILEANGASLEGLEARLESSGQAGRDFDAAADRLTLSIGQLISKGMNPLARAGAFVADGLAMAITAATDLDSLIDGVQQATTGYQKYEEAQNALQGASEETRKRYAAENAVLQDAIDKQRQAIDRAQALARAGKENTAEYRQAMDAARSWGEVAEGWGTRVTTAVTEATKAEQVQARATAEAAAAQQAAAGDIGGALATLRETTGLTGEQFEALAKTMRKAADEGQSAFAGAVATEISFLEDRKAAREGFTQQINDLEQGYWTRLAELQQERLGAETAEQKAAIDQQIADLQKGFQDKTSAAEAAFKAQEQKAAEAYAKQQAAQLAHLGRMLMDYASAQARMAGLSEQAIGEMNAKIAAEYGVQASVVDRSFGQMTSSIDAWVASGGQNTDKYIGDMGRVRSETVATQQEVDRQIKLMTEQARADFEAGKLTTEQYAEKLRTIPAAAEVAAASLRTIPTTINSTVTITTVRRDVTGAPAGDQTTRTATTSSPGVSGKRALGGPVEPQKMYEVNEDEVPELLGVGGKTFLLMGSTAGVVRPALQAAAGRSLGSGGVEEDPAGAAYNRLYADPRYRDKLARSGREGLVAFRRIWQTGDYRGGDLGVQEDDPLIEALFDARDAAKRKNNPMASLQAVMAGQSAMVRQAVAASTTTPTAGTSGAGGMVFAPTIAIHNPIVDNAARLEQLKTTILDAAKKAAEQSFGSAVEKLILSGGSA